MSTLQEHIPCCQCQKYQFLIENYIKLIGLLHKKIHRLEKKINIQPQNIVEHTTNSQINQANIQTIQNNNQSVTKNKNLCISQKRLEQQKKQSAHEDQMRKIQLKTKTSTMSGSFFSKTQNISEARTSSSEGVEEKEERTAVLINALTEEIIKLKSTFMHVRHCFYAFVKSIMHNKHIFDSSISFNLTLALMNIFEYSEEQREQMFDAHQTKVKHKKRQQLLHNKENLLEKLNQH